MAPDFASCREKPGSQTRFYLDETRRTDAFDEDDKICRRQAIGTCQSPAAPRTGWWTVPLLWFPAVHDWTVSCILGPWLLGTTIHRQDGRDENLGRKTLSDAENLTVDVTVATVSFCVEYDPTVSCILGGLWFASCRKKPSSRP